MIEVYVLASCDLLHIFLFAHTKQPCSNGVIHHDKLLDRELADREMTYCTV